MTDKLVFMSFHETRSAVWSCLGQQCIALKNQTKIQIWDVEKGDLLIEFPGPQGDIYDMVLSPDGRFIATAEGFENPMVNIWGIPA
jgi:WD40 repeat protein